MNKFDIDMDIDNFNPSSSCLLSVDEQFRYSWNLGSFCSIYSRSTNRWFIGQIINIYIDKKTNKEWFTVKYNGNKKKQIQRLCEDLKPITPPTSDFNKNRNKNNKNKIDDYLLDKLTKNVKSQQSNAIQGMIDIYFYINI